MAATPFKLALTVVNSSGQVKSIPMTVSDVNAQFALYPSGADELPLSTQPCSIKDIVLTAAGIDTSQLQVWVNGFNTGYVIYDALNIGSVLNRQVQNAPINIPANATLKFVQVT